MICKKCGKDNKPKSEYCSYCGERFTVLLDNDEKFTPKKGENLMVGIIVVLITLFIIIAGIIIYNTEPKGKEGKQEEFQGGGETIPEPETSEKQPEAVVVEPEKPSDSPENSKDAPDEDAPEELIPDKQPENPEPAPAIPESDKEVPDVHPEEPDIEVPETPEKDDETPGSKRLEAKKTYRDTADEIEAYINSNISPTSEKSVVARVSNVASIKYDTLMQNLLKYLSSVLTDEELDSLIEGQALWLNERKEAVTEAAIRAKSNAEDITTAQNLMSIEYTSKRCDYLISLIG